MIRLLIILGLLVILVPLTAAERGFVPVRRTEGSFVALVIGNGAYPDAQLANPVNDATDVAAALEGIGFRVTRLLDADREQMAAGIAQFGEQLANAKAAVFFYAGHGVQVKDFSARVWLSSPLLSSLEMTSTTATPRLPRTGSR